MTFTTTISEIYSRTFPDAPLERLGRSQEMRIGHVLRKLGMIKKQVMIDGKRKVLWMLTPEKSNELKEQNAKSTKDMFDEYDPTTTSTEDN